MITFFSFLLIIKFSFFTSLHVIEYLTFQKKQSNGRGVGIQVLIRIIYYIYIYIYIIIKVFIR